MIHIATEARRFILLNSCTWKLRQHKSPRIIFISLMTVLCANIYAQPWWDTHWRYRFHIEVNTADVACIDKLVETKINFNEKFEQVRALGKQVHIPSIRVIETDAVGNTMAERLCQYDVDELLWILHGSTPTHGVRHFDVYFNADDRPTLATTLAPLVTRRDSTDRWIFNTTNGYYVFEQRGGAFEVVSPAPCKDNENGKDWMRDDYNRWNGILNVGDPHTKAIFHPNEDDEADDSISKGPRSFIQCAGPLRYRLKSINRFGELTDDLRSKTVYSIQYDILPYGVRARMLQGNKDGYACIMELTPGGDLSEPTDYVVRSDGTKKFKNEKWAEDISPEWLYVGDSRDENKLYFVHAEDDTIKDGLHWYENMQAVMVGWGRGANPGIHQYPNTFYFGFAREATHQEMKSKIESLLTPVAMVIGKTERVDDKEWGSIQIEEISGSTQVVLENSRLRLKYGSVQTANQEIAITELYNKMVNENQAGKHIDEMAHGKGKDRGVLSSGTSLTYDGTDKKTVHLEWDDGASIEEVTLFPDKPYVRIEYLKMYVNICDIGNPGGVNKGRYVLHGAKEWQAQRKKILADSGFKNSENPHHRLTDALYPVYPNPILGDWGIPYEKNPMNYKGWYIMGVFNPKNGHGYGRVIPAEAVDHLKLLFGNGFEQFPFWFEKSKKKPFSNYLFVVSHGEKEILSLGKEIVEQANRDSGFRENAASRSIGNSWLDFTYGPDRLMQGLYVNGVTKLLYRPTNENFSQDLDVSGCGYAQYHTVDGVNDFSVTSRTRDYIEATVKLKGCVDIQKAYRLYRDLPLLEIRYDSLKILWWEDFYSAPLNDRRAYTIYGIEPLITESLHDSLRKVAETTCGHNFGDCYLAAAGSTVAQSMYKGFFIFGFHDQDTGLGMGFVMPENVGTHNGFKLWSMYNYETFPFYKMDKKLPLTRWIFITEKGREGILRVGKALADMVADGKTITEVRKSLQVVF